MDIEEKLFELFPGFLYLFRKMIWNTAWDLEEWLFAEVTPDVRTLFPCAISRNTSSALVMVSSLRPTTCTCCLWSSSTRNFCFLFNKSNTYNRQKYYKYTDWWKAWAWKAQDDMEAADREGLQRVESSRLSTFMINIPGDLVWDLPCVQQASYLEGGQLMWMLPLYLHVNK